MCLRLIISRDTLYSYTCGKGCFFGSVSAIRIDEEVFKVYLVLVEVQSGDCTVVMDDEADVVVVCTGTDVVPESSSMTFEYWWS